DRDPAPVDGLELADLVPHHFVAAIGQHVQTRLFDVVFRKFELRAAQSKRARHCYFLTRFSCGSMCAPGTSWPALIASLMGTLGTSVVTVTRFHWSGI